MRKLTQLEAYILSVITAHPEARNEIIKELISRLLPNGLYLIENILHGFASPGNEEKLVLDFSKLADGPNSILNKGLAKFKTRLKGSNIENLFSCFHQPSLITVDPENIKAIRQKMHVSLEEFYVAKRSPIVDLARNDYKEIFTLILQGVPIAIIDRLYPTREVDPTIFIEMMTFFLARYKSEHPKTNANQEDEFTKKQQAMAIGNCLRFIVGKYPGKEDDLAHIFGKKLMDAGFETFILSKAGFTEEGIEYSLELYEGKVNYALWTYENNFLAEIKAILTSEELQQEKKEEKLACKFSQTQLQGFVEFEIKRKSSLVSNVKLAAFLAPISEDIIIAAINNCRKDMDQHRLAVFLLKNGFGKKWLLDAGYSEGKVDEAEKQKEVDISQRSIREKFIAYFAIKNQPLSAEKAQKIREGMCFGFAVFENLLALEEDPKYFFELMFAIASLDGKAASLNDKIELTGESSMTRGEIIEFVYRKVDEYQAAQKIPQQLIISNAELKHHTVIAGTNDRARLAQVLTKLQKYLEQHSDEKMVFLLEMVGHSVRFSYDVATKTWVFRENNDTVSAEKFIRVDDFISRILRMAPEQDISIIGLAKSFTPEFCKKFVELKQLSLFEMLTGNGSVLIFYDQKLLSILLKEAATNHELALSLAEVLKHENKDSWTGFDLMTQNAPNKLPNLIALAERLPELRNSLAEALRHQNKNGFTGFYFMIHNAPDKLPALFALVGKFPELRNSLAELLKHDGKDGWTGFDFMTDLAPDKLPDLFALAERLPELRNSLAEALRHQNKNGFTGFYFMIHNAPNKLPNLIALAEKQPIIMFSLLDSLPSATDFDIDLAIEKGRNKYELGLRNLKKTLIETLGFQKPTEDSSWANVVEKWKFNALSKIVTLAEKDNNVRCSLIDSFKFAATETKEQVLGLIIAKIKRGCAFFLNVQGFHPEFLMELLMKATEDDLLRARIIQDKNFLDRLNDAFDYSIGETGGLINDKKTAQKEIIGCMFNLLSEIGASSQHSLSNFFGKRTQVSTLKKACQLAALLDKKEKMIDPPKELITLANDEDKAFKKACDSMFGFLAKYHGWKDFEFASWHKSITTLPTGWTHSVY